MKKKCYSTIIVKCFRFIIFLKISFRYVHLLRCVMRTFKHKKLFSKLCWHNLSSPWGAYWRYNCTTDNTIHVGVYNIVYTGSIIHMLVYIRVTVDIHRE